MLYLSYPYEVVDGVRFEGVGPELCSSGKAAYPAPLISSYAINGVSSDTPKSKGQEH